MKVNGRILLALCAIYAISELCWMPTLVSEEPRMRVTINGAAEIVKKRDGKYYLLMKISNASDKPISLFKDMLPWTTNSGTVILVEAHTKKPIKQVHAITDPGPATIELRANEQIHGELCLSDCFVLSDSPASEDVDVFWAYRLKTVDGLHSNRVGGWLLFSRKPNQ
jgi:hypothetical protein